MSLKSFNAQLDALKIAPDDDRAQVYKTLGPTLSALVASKTEGLILELDADKGLASAWIQAGLHADIPFVLIGEDSDTLAITEAALPPDLRMAFHKANADTFVADMSDKRFAMVVDHRLHSDGETLTAIEAIMERGAFLVTRLGDHVSLPEAFKRANLGTSDWSLLTLGPKPIKRRGGRKARVSSTGE